MPDPQLSVVIAAGSQREQAARAIASALAQQTAAEFEVIVVDACPDQPLPGIESDSIRICPAHNRQTIAELRAEGARQAKAPIVAFLENMRRRIPAGPPRCWRLSGDRGSAWDLPSRPPTRIAG